MKRLLLVFLTSIAAVAQAGSIGGEVSVRGFERDFESVLLAPAGHVSVLGVIQAGETVWLRARLDALAAMESSPRQLAIRDNSSNVSVGWRRTGWSDEEGVMLSLFPFSAERLHLGFSYPLSWGRALYLYELDPTSAAKLEFARAGWRAFAAVKTQRLEDEMREPTRTAMAMFGVGVSLPAGFEVDLQGAWGPEARVSDAFGPGFGVAHLSRGISARLAHRYGAIQERILDVMLEGGDPAYFDRLAAQQKYEPGISTYLGIEATQIWNDLRHPDRNQGVVTDGAPAAAIDARLQVARARVQTLFGYRSYNFLRDYQRYPAPFVSIGTGVTEPNLFAHVAADYSFERSGLTPGIALSAALPATVTPAAPLLTNYEPEGFPVGSKLVLHDGSLEVVPLEKERETILGAQLLLRWDPNPGITVMAQVGFSHFPDNHDFIHAEGGGVETVQAPRTSWNGAITMQGRC